MASYNIRWGFMGTYRQQLCHRRIADLASNGVDCRGYGPEKKWTRALLTAAVFAKDLLIDPTLRNAGDVSHTITAVSSSSSEDRAREFIAEVGIPAPCAAYGSYEALVADPNVDVVYVATPHSHHFQNVMLALNAKKHVLCEKAFTVNAAQARILTETAKKNNLFLMEAVWTRYQPISVRVRELIKAGEIGEVLRVTADLSFGGIEGFRTEHRMVNKDLAGGCLLDCMRPGPVLVGCC